MLITAGQAQAQQVTVDASIDSLQLLIGEQAKVKLEISMDAKQKLQLPFLRDTSWIICIAVPMIRSTMPP